MPHPEAGVLASAAAGRTAALGAELLGEVAPGGAEDPGCCGRCCGAAVVGGSCVVLGGGYE